MRVALLFLLIFGSLLLNGQEFIKGKVVDGETGEPMIYAVVSCGALSDSVLTNMNGEFEIECKGDSLHVSFLGYQDIFVSISEENTRIKIKMNTDFDAISFAPAEVLVPRIFSNTTSPVHRINRKAIEVNDGFSYPDILNQTPGLFMHTGTLNTNRITIRGIGSRNLFGTAKIRAYLDDIPLTNGTGETSIEDIDPSFLRSIRVHKGPAPTAYGAALGGVIALQTRYPSRDALSYQFTGGSFGLLRNNVNWSKSDDNYSHLLSLHQTHSNGYRTNNEYDRYGALYKGNYRINQNHHLSLLLNYVDLKGFIPSSLNEDTFRDNPSAADTRWGAVEGNEDNYKFNGGLNYKALFGTDWEVSTSVFFNLFKNDELRPFGWLFEDSEALGIRSVAKYEPLEKWSVTLGTEFYREFYDQITNEQNDGEVGIRESANDQDRRYWNLFANAQYQFSDRFWAEMGVNYNRTWYDFDDLFIINGTDQSGSYDFDGVLSPRIGFGYNPNDLQTIYLSLSHGFNAPSVEETLTPEGLLNDEIEPEFGWNLELGTRGRSGSNDFEYDLSVYNMFVDDLLVARRVDQDQFVGINAGETNHFGVDAYVRKRWTDYFSSWVTYTFSRFTFEEYEDLGEVYDGNELTGVAPHQLQVGAAYELIKDLTVSARYQFTDEMPLRDDNSVYSESFQLFDARLAYDDIKLGRARGHVFFGLRNVLDERYASMLLINAGSFGGRAPRYYYPGLPRNWYAGVRVTIL